MIRTIIAAVSVSFGAQTAVAEVTAQSEESFESTNQVVVPGNPDDNYRRFVENVGQWWSGNHTFSGDPSNLYIDERCFCERWDGGWVEHLRLVHAAPGKALRLKGGLGPLQAFPVAGSMDIGFAAADGGGTAVTIVYKVRGVPAETWAGPVDGVLAEQITGFKAFAEGAGR